jgi:hypothetical protein
MTLAIAWIRTIGTSQELLCATDSRLRFGGHWDCGPKLYPTPRGDSAIMFAGDTIYAYPIIQHINMAISQHRKLRSRAMDLEHLKGHLLRVLHETLSRVEDLAAGHDTNPIVEFIFTGFDWRDGEFKGWLFHFDKSINRFTHRKMSRWDGSGSGIKALTISGDYQAEFKRRLVSLLKERGKIDQGGFDMEPFEVLRDMLRTQEFNCIGGAPQLAKIYPHLNCRPVAIYWPNRASGSVSLGGRQLLEYEAHEFMTLDPDTLTFNDN